MSQIMQTQTAFTLTNFFPQMFLRSRQAFVVEYSFRVNHANEVIRSRGESLAAAHSTKRDLSEGKILIDQGQVHQLRLMLGNVFEIGGKKGTMTEIELNMASSVMKEIAQRTDSKFPQARGRERAK
jgi:hypothetical protein